MNGTKIFQRKFIILTLALAVVIALPFIITQVTAPDGYLFNGRLGQNDGDYYVYFSQMEQARQGNLTFYNLFTTEGHQPIIFNPVWLIMGWLGKITGLSNQIIFHLLRIILIPLLAWSAWCLVKYFLKDRPQIFLSCILILFGGGLVNYSLTTDASPFNAMLFSPHLILSLLFLIFSIINFDKYLTDNKTKHLIIAGAFSFLLSLFHPYQISTLVIIFGLYVFGQYLVSRERKLLIKYIKWLLFIIPIAFYYWWLFAALPFGDIWIEQSDALMRIRTPWELMISFGPVVILAVIGLIHKIKTKNYKIFFISLWAMIPFFLMSIPMFFRMRSTGGMFIPLAILSAIGIIHIADKIRIILLRRLVIVLLVLVICFSSFTTWLRIVGVSIALPETSFISQNQKDAFDWSRENLMVGDSMIASWYISNLIPGYTGRSVYLGHGIQTPYYLDSYLAVNNFFSLEYDDEWKINFLKTNSLDYVWYSDWEKNYGDFNPGTADYLSEVYSNAEIEIYKFNK